MKIVVTGGGSGGHITPILAVASELKTIDQTIEIDYIGQKGDGFADIPAQDPNISATYSVRAGKFRRYHGEGWKQILDVPTMYKNIRDAFRVVIGVGQSIVLLRRLRPNIIFTRGGYVSVPVGLAAGFLKIPYITHDSDGIPSLANRIIAKRAVLHAVALPKDLYPYKQSKTLTVGVPVSDQYRHVTPAAQEAYRRELGLTKYKQIVLVTGGGLGAQRLNDAAVANAKTLLQQFPDLYLVHLSGRANYSDVQDDYAALQFEPTLTRVKVVDYTTELYKYSAAADVIVTRAGATSIAEFAMQARTCIVVPNPQLTGGHQSKNSMALKKAHAIVELTEDQIMQEGRLAHTVADLLHHPEKRAELAATLSTFAHPDSAKRLAMVLLDKASVDTADNNDTKK
jgi:UDP-N-acetylglucosamine--N-acetylmuramyl-(pentapeptide) pyrophosphoryl-undecaprenol N-acetylglucosamine transferase